MTKFEPGDFFLIPAGEKYGLAKVIYCSEYFRDVVLIKLFRKACSTIEDAEIPDEEAAFDLYYTGSDSILKGQWKKLANQAVSPREGKLSRRIVGGDVWIADEHIGVASEHELMELPKMLTYGARLIEKAVSRLS